MEPDSSGWDSDDWAGYREAVRDERQARHARGVSELAQVKAAGYQVRQLTPWHFRVDGVVDLYPTNRRYLVLKTGKRGGYGRETALNLLARLVPKKAVDTRNK